MSSTVTACDLFKKKDEVQSPDYRVTLFGGDTDTNFNLFYDEIAKIKLSSHVPSEVVIHFETSKNTLLYSFYVYRMSSVAILYSFSALEKALKIRLNSEKHMALRQKMKLAVRNGFISPQDIPFSSYAESLNNKLDAFCDFRNRLSHNPDFLGIIWSVPSVLNRIALTINTLFSPRENAKPTPN